MASNRRGRKQSVRPHPRPDELWLSRPPYLLITHITAVVWAGDSVLICYEFLDEDGSRLGYPTETVLDESWWANFQPLIRRSG